MISRLFYLARQKGLEPPTLRTGIAPELTLVLRKNRINVAHFD